MAKILAMSNHIFAPNCDLLLNKAASLLLNKPKPWGHPCYGGWRTLYPVQGTENYFCVAADVSMPVERFLSQCSYQRKARGPHHLSHIFTHMWVNCVCFQLVCCPGTHSNWFFFPTVFLFDKKSLFQEMSWLITGAKNWIIIFHWN